MINELHELSRMNKKDLKSKLDELYRRNNTEEFIESDPVQFVHQYRSRNDREIAAFLTATIAWGRRDLIIKSAEKMFSLMGKGPYDYIMKGNYHNLRVREPAINTSIHRTFFEEDLRYFCRGLRACYEHYGNLEKLFASAPDLWEGIGLFREVIAGANSSGKPDSPEYSPVYSKHIANPASASACKRLFLALRWLVRREGPVDLGLWKGISPSSLYIPLDLHVGRVAREFGLLDKNPKANNKKAVISLTEKLRELCPEDPVKYDLALFGLGIEQSK